MNKLLVATALCFMLGCGTDTGNPGLINPSSGMGTPIFVEQAVASTCRKMMDCHPGLSEADCRHGLYSLNNLDTVFGLQDERYATLADVAAAELKGELSPKSDSAVSCLKSISQLTCSDPLVVQAYQPLAPQKFSEVHKIFAPVCQSVY
jgi:hypothetical protein